MSIEFIESSIPYRKTVKAVVVTDSGDVHSFEFGKDVPRSRMVQLIHTLIPKSNRRVKRKAVN